jgi:dolichol-phosphate mannosyltransferase
VRLANRLLEKHRFLKFVIVGGMGFFLNMGILYGLTESGLYYMASSVIAIVLCMTFNYTVNNYWTFKSRRKGAKGYLQGLWKYALVSFIGDGLSFGLLVLFTEVAGLWYMASMVAAVFIVAVFRYVVVRRFIWRVKDDAVAEKA